MSLLKHRMQNTVNPLLLVELGSKLVPWVSRSEFSFLGQMLPLNLTLNEWDIKIKLFFKDQI